MNGELAKPIHGYRHKNFQSHNVSFSCSNFRGEEGIKKKSDEPQTQTYMNRKCECTRTNYLQKYWRAWQSYCLKNSNYLLNSFQEKSVRTTILIKSLASEAQHYNGAISTFKEIYFRFHSPWLSGVNLPECETISWILAIHRNRVSSTITNKQTNKLRGL
jgi:hypothetical protein